jgi:DNA-directed RNA polymerase specialized sigma24 family protein
MRKLFLDNIGLLKRHAQRIVKRPEVAEEIVQDAYINMHLHNFPANSVGLYICHVQFRALNHLRDTKEDLDFTDTPNELVYDTTPYDLLLKTQSFQRAMNFVNQLPRKQKSAVKSMMQNDSFKEAAAAAGTHSVTHRVNFNAGIKNIKAKMGSK